MKNAERNFAKIKVLKCEEKLNNQTGQQDMDKEGNPLWNVYAMDLSYNEEFGFMEQKAVRYKSLEKIEPGDRIVEFKSLNMGEGSGSFIKVNTFYTILRSVAPKTSLEGIFGTDLLMPELLTKPKHKEAAKQVSVQ